MCCQSTKPFICQTEWTIWMLKVSFIHTNLLTWILRSLRDSWKWLRLHWESFTSQFQWGKITIRPGRKPSTRWSANWTAMCPLNLKEITLDKPNKEQFVPQMLTKCGLTFLKSDVSNVRRIYSSQHQYLWLHVLGWYLTELWMLDIYWKFEVLVYNIGTI